MKNRNNMRLIIAIAVIALTVATGQGITGQRKHGLGDIPLSKEFYDKHIKKSSPNERTVGEGVETSLPSSYDARVYGLVTPAKNQWSCGSCWAFASVGALESHLLKSGLAGQQDFSEQQQVSCNTEQTGCAGGSSTAIKYWEDSGGWGGDNSKGPLNEPDFPYTGSDATACKEDNQLSYRVTDWHTIDSSEFKNSLYNEGPSYWRYDVYSDFDTYWDFGSPGEVYVNKANSTKEGGHAVLLIGWDDNKSAYLCKNSWGETGGPNGDGTFWIAYSGHFHDLGFGMANFSVTSKDSLAYSKMMDAPSDLEIMRRYRDTVLSKTSKGKIYVEELYKNSEEALKVLNDNPELMNRAGELIQMNKDAVADVLTQENGTIHNTDAITDFLADYAKASPSDLRFLVNKVRVDMKQHKKENKLFFGFRLE